MRTATLWISPHGTLGNVEVIDLKSLNLDEPWPPRLLLVQGLDTFPHEALLVVVHPADLARIRARMNVITLPGMLPTYEQVAETIINDMIAKVPELRKQFGLDVA